MQSALVLKENFLDQFFMNKIYNWKCEFKIFTKSKCCAKKDYNYRFCRSSGCIKITTSSNQFLSAEIFFVILEIFLEAFCFFITPVFAIFINSEFNLGKNLIALDLSFFSIKKFF